MAKNFFERIEANEDITFDFLGDSITYGQIHCRPEETYVAKFTKALADAIPSYTVYRCDGVPEAGSAYPMKHFEKPVLCSVGDGEGRIDVVKNGIGGSTVLKATERPQDYTGILPSGKRHDYVFLMFGINDALFYDKGKFVSGKQFKENCKKLIEILKNDNPDVSIVITSATTPTILSHEVHPKLVPEENTIKVCEIDDYVKNSEELAREEGYAYIDTNALWNEHRKEGEEHYGHGDWLVGRDSCHPSPKASDIMGRFVCDEFLRLAKEGKV